MGKAADLLADLLESAQEEISDLQEANDRLRRHLPWTDHYPLPDDAPDLPVPRLELEWCEGSPYLPGNSWCCRYSLVYRHFQMGKWEGATGVMCVPMGYTGLGGGGELPRSIAELDMPFRDGAHAQSDAAQLGLPLYVRHGSKWREVSIAAAL